MSFSTVWPGVVSSLTILAIFALFIYLGKKLKFGGALGPSGRYIKVVDKCFAGPGSYLLIAQVGGRCFLIGVSGSSVSPLFELSPEDLQRVKKDAGSFKELLSEAKLNKASWLKKKKED